jgi:NADH dehydrogenase
LDEETRSDGAGVRRVVIVGGGYAGTITAVGLARGMRPGDGLEVVVLEPNPCQQALSELDLVAAGPSRPEFCEVWYPQVFRGLPVTMRYERVADVQPSTHEVVIGSWDGDRLGYWRLVLATGAVPWVPPVPGLAEHALTMWSVEDAQELQTRTADLFKEAARIPDADTRREVLSFAIVGGGATGVEVVGTLAQLLPRRMKANGLDPADLRITLIEGRPDILYDLRPALRARAVSRLERMGVRVATSSPVAGVDAERITLEDGSAIPARVVVVATGARADPHAMDWGLRADASGRLCVGLDLLADHVEGIYVIGDVAAARDPATGRTLPMLAQMAIQEGKHTAENILAEARGEATTPFVPNMRGEFVSVGPRWGVGWMFGRDLSGIPAILMKRVTYVKYWLMVGGVPLAWKRTVEMLSMGW